MPHVMVDVHKYPDVRARSEKKVFTVGKKYLSVLHETKIISENTALDSHGLQ